MSASNSFKLKASAKKLAAGLHVPQTEDEAEEMVNILQEHIKGNAGEYDADDDPQVDIAVHTLQSHAPSSMEFVTSYEKVADKKIAGFGEIIKAAANILDDGALRQLTSYGSYMTNNNNNNNNNYNSKMTSSVLQSSTRVSTRSDTIDNTRKFQGSVKAIDRVGRDALETVMSPSAWGKIQQVKAPDNTRVSAVESPSSLMAELARVNLGRVPASKGGARRTMMSGKNGDNTNARNSHFPDSPYYDEIEDTPIAISFNTPICIRTGSGMYLNTLKQGSLGVELDSRPNGPWEFGNAAFRDDDGVVKFGDVLTVKLGVGHRLTLNDATTNSPLASAICLVADHAMRTVALRQRALGGADRWALFDPNKPPGLGGSSDGSTGTLASCNPVVIRANAGQFLSWENGNRLPILSSEPRVWYIVHYNAPYVVPCPSALVPTTYSNVNSSTKSSNKLLSATSNQKEKKILPLGSYPLQIQEQLLVEDLLYVLLGIHGKYINVNHLGGKNKREDENIFNLETTRGIDPSLTYLIRRISPVAGAYSVVSQYVDSHNRYEYGMTCHALCAAVRSLMKEFTILVAQLEHSLNSSAIGLSLQRLFFYIQPSLYTLQALEKLVIDVGNAKGGALLDKLSRLSAVGGDRKSREMYKYLQTCAAKPYYEMLTEWVYEGKIKDPYNEFLISVNESQQATNLLDDFNTKYWEERYTIRDTMVAEELKSLAGKILVTGKYLNVLNSVVLKTNSYNENDKNKQEDVSGDDLKNDKAVKLVPGANRENAEAIEQAFSFASKALLKLMMGPSHQLIQRLRALKHYFLIDQGDFFVHFMHIAEDELRKECSVISTGKLEGLLDASITLSVLGEDSYRENLRCALLPYTLIQHLELVQQLSNGNENFDDEKALEATRAKLQHVRNQRLKGMEAFALDYAVEWPISLVISRKELTKYQLVFRHLFFCNHVQRQLSKTWLGHQSLKEMDLRGVLTPSYILRQKMLHFMQNFLYYMMVEVLEVRHHQFETALRKVKTLDNVLEYHAEFLDTCLKECLLSHHELLRCVTKIMSVCLLFSEQMEHFSEVNRLEELLMEDRTLNSASNPEAIAARKKNALRARRARLEVQSNQIRRIVAKPEYVRMIHRFQSNFDSTLGMFMKRLIDLARSDGEYQTHVANLVTRLDYNGFYGQYLDLSQINDAGVSNLNSSSIL